LTGNILYVNDNLRDSDGDIHLSTDEWYTLEVIPSNDLDINWSSVTSVRVQLRVGGSYMYNDVIHARFDDLKLGY